MQVTEKKFPEEKARKAIRKDLEEQRGRICQRGDLGPLPRDNGKRSRRVLCGLQQTREETGLVGEWRRASRYRGKKKGGTHTQKKSRMEEKKI